MTDIHDENAQAAQEFDASWEDAVAGREPADSDRLSGLGTRLIAEFNEAERMRHNAELRWLMDLRQYKGLYEPEVEASLKDRSKAFKRLTSTKVDTLTALMLELLFPSGKDRNYTLEPSARPSLAPAKMNEIKDALRAATGGGQGVTREVIDAAIRDAATKCAHSMGAVIDDQLSESRYRRTSKAVLFSGCLYGTGVLKGPLATKEQQISYVFDERRRRYIEKVVEHTRPRFEQIPIWRFYPDMEATDIKDCRYVWEHHRLTKSSLIELSRRPGFDEAALIEYSRTYKDGCADRRTYESELRNIGEKQTFTLETSGLYDVFERYGWIDGEDLAACGVDIAQERRHEVFFANVWVMPNGQVVRVQRLRPGAGYIYHLFQFREDETSIFAEGIATVMRDDQDMTNAATRAAIDNAAVTAGAQLVLNMKDLAPNEDTSNIRPFRIWKQISGDSQYSPVKAVELPNHTTQLLSLAQYFEQSADDTTMVPRYMTGDNPTNGAAATMGGLSMLLGQGKISIKSLAVNFDEGITRPALTALVGWNMLYHPDQSIKGDFVVIARGASSLVAKEVRAQQATQFTAGLSPEERKYVKFLPLLREKAAANEFDDIVMSDAEAKEADNNPAMQQAQQVQQMAVELDIAKKKAELLDLTAKTQKTQMETLRQKALAMGEFMKGLYVACQAAGIVIQDPKVAAAADEIARSGGFLDQTPQEQVQAQAQSDAVPTAIPAPQTPQPAPVPSAAPAVPQPQAGAERGIETAALGMAQ